MPTLDYDARLAQLSESIAQSPRICPSNKDYLREFDRDLLLDGIGQARRYKLLSHLKIIAEQLGEQPFDTLDVDDTRELVAWLYTRDITHATIRDYKQILKQFYRWLNSGEDPPATRWLNSKHERRQPLPRKLLGPADVDALIDGCVNARDKALVAVLWEIGARIGELIDLTVADLEQTSEGTKIIVDGKTGSRRLLLLESEPHVETWLRVHPAHRPTAPLWCKIEQGDCMEPIGYNYIRLRLLERAKRRAGIDKPVNPHHFRHSRATYLANWLTEAQLCEWFGWVQGSRVPGRYVHLSGRDIDRVHRSLLQLSEYESLASTSGKPR
ncbi:tyrosine-type recombinase/integrase [Haloarchaeobius sp. DFWS5]|uniref:tyrosine-type recombinase/integrase n=1 Tax=Haloarchaeobius sp. DFWS5 TaxID=3446114 RepID=UPI003EBA929A